MFKALGNLIHKTPWWAVVVGGMVVLASLVLFATPVHVIRLHGSGATPQEKKAIEREISLAFGDTALNFAEDVVRAMRERATDPDRQRELDRALAEIARAKRDLAAAQSSVSQAVRDQAHEAADAAMESAKAAAEAALDAAVEAREAVEEAQRDAVELLRSRGLDPVATERSFDAMLEAARDKERAAREALESMQSLRKQPVPVAPAAVPEPAASGPAPAASGTVRKPMVIINGSPVGPATFPLPEQMREDIRAKVDTDVWRVGVGSVLILTFIPLYVLLLISKVLLARSRRALAVAEAKTEEAELSQLQRQLSEARLQALQAQIEPHFLYNTLANVQALTEVDAGAAHRMVGHLIDYLRATLPKMRENTSTLGQELERVRAYLAILQMRMGERLQFSVEAAPELLGRPFPPLLLPTLVENAIKHGLEPQREGGRIDVRAERVETPAGARMVLRVTDTGRGMSDTPGGGVGLNNVRERLAAMYDGSARCTISANTPRGVVAAIDVPLEVAPTASERAATKASAETPPSSGWQRTVRITRRSHHVWSFAVSRLAIGLLIALVALFVVALVALYTGWMPVQVGDLRLDGLEGMALGSVGLLAAFGGVALAILLLVAVIYGLGFLFAGLLFLIPAIIVVSLFPVALPGVALAFAIMWAVKRRRGRRSG